MLLPQKVAKIGLIFNKSKEKLKKETKSPSNHCRQPTNIWFVNRVQLLKRKSYSASHTSIIDGDQTRECSRPFAQMMATICANGRGQSIIAMKIYFISISSLFLVRPFTLQKRGNNILLSIFCKNALFSAFLFVLL